MRVNAGTGSASNKHIAVSADKGLERPSRSGPPPCGEKPALDAMKLVGLVLDEQRQFAPQFDPWFGEAAGRGQLYSRRSARWRARSGGKSTGAWWRSLCSARTLARTSITHRMLRKARYIACGWTRALRFIGSASWTRRCRRSRTRCWRGRTSSFIACSPSTERQ